MLMLLGSLLFYGARLLCGRWRQALEGHGPDEDIEVSCARLVSVLALVSGVGLLFLLQLPIGMASVENLLGILSPLFRSG